VDASPENRMSMSDSLLVHVPLRAEDVIRKEIDQANAEKLAADDSERTAMLLQARTESQIRIKEAERKSMESNLKLAEHEKNDIAQSEWRGRMRLAELEKKLLQQRENLRGGEIALAKARRAHSEAWIKGLESELELQQKYKQRAQFAGRERSAEVVAAMAQFDADVDALEKRTLRQHLDSARKRQQVATQETELLRHRLKVLEAQASLARGR